MRGADDDVPFKVVASRDQTVCGLQDLPYKNLTEPTYNLPFIFGSSANWLKDLSNIAA